MDTDPTFIYSETDFTEFSNTSNTTTEFTPVEEPFEWTNAEIARLIQIIFKPILIIHPAGTSVSSVKDDKPVHSASHYGE